MLTFYDDFYGKVYLTKQEFKNGLFSYCVLWFGRSALSSSG